MAQERWERQPVQASTESSRVTSKMAPDVEGEVDEGVGRQVMDGHRPTRVMAARTGTGRGPERPPAQLRRSRGGRRVRHTLRPRPRKITAAVRR